MKKEYLFYLAISTIFIFIVSPSLFSKGMFMDGILYADISKNLAHGIGSFWDLKITETFYPHFHEHPPLVFALQSIFFRIFNDTLVSERIYSLFTFFLTAWVITKIWKEITIKDFHNIAWFPLFLTLSVPVTTWSAANNMLENTMMVFTSSSILFIIKSTKSNRLINLIIGGFILFLAFMSKGLVALYILSFLFWYWIFIKNSSLKDFIISSSILLISFLMPFLIIYLTQPEGIDSLMAYFNKQIVRSIDEVVTVESRLFIVKRLFNELIPSGIIVLLIIIFTRKSKIKLDRSEWGFIFFATALSGVIPIMISMKQSGFYILSTYPLFAIAFSLLIAPKLSFLVEKINIKSIKYKIFTIAIFIAFGFSIVFAYIQTKNVSRDKDIISDIYTLKSVVPDNSTISISPNLYKNWALHGYFYRYSNINLDKLNFYHKYLLVPLNYKDTLLNNYTKYNIKLKYFELFEHNTSKINQDENTDIQRNIN